MSKIFTFVKWSAVLCAVIAMSLLVGCGAFYISQYSDLSKYQVSDIKSYYAAEEYTKPSRLVDMTVQEVCEEMDNGSTFVLLCGYADCPWCNAIITYINDIATEQNVLIAYIDTRKDPSWESNLDLLDYDLFVEKFGDRLETDDDGILHLYVPHMFFIKNGEVIGDHRGTVDGQEDPHEQLTKEQLEEFCRMFYDEITNLKHTSLFALLK